MSISQRVCDMYINPELCVVYRCGAGVIFWSRGKVHGSRWHWAIQLRIKATESSILHRKWHKAIPNNNQQERTQDNKAQGLWGRCDVSDKHYWDRNKSRQTDRGAQCIMGSPLAVKAYSSVAMCRPVPALTITFVKKEDFWAKSNIEMVSPWP